MDSPWYVAELCRRDERIRELESARLSGWPSIEAVAASVDLLRQTKEVEARIATLERELAEARTDCHDRNHVGLREVLCGARLPDASLGQDAALAAHLLGAMEAELAEARQRDEDATDLILRQGRELAAMRPKAEAAERAAAWLRADHRDSYPEEPDLAMWLATHPPEAHGEELRSILALLAACPEKGGAG